MESKNNTCQFLEWDSNFFGARIARLTGETLNEEIITAAFSWCRDNKIDCLYFLASAEDKETARTIEKTNFKLTDVKITLETKLKTFVPQNKIEQKKIVRASGEDIEQLRQIASTNHRDSRFYYDKSFSTEKCDELFAVWIEKSCQGFADAVLVSKSGAAIEGYITCSIDKQKIGSIGLVGVSPKCQGQGVGKNLVRAALNWFAENNAEHVTVVTQGRNVRAQRLYQKNGFVTGSLKLWYHLWFD